MKGMYESYGKGLWTFHCEHEEEDDRGDVIAEMDVVEGHGVCGDEVETDDMEGLLRACLHPAQEDPIGEAIPESDAFRSLIDDANTPLYPGCIDYSKLSFLIGLYHIKCPLKIRDTFVTS